MRTLTWLPMLRVLAAVVFAVTFAGDALAAGDVRIRVKGDELVVSGIRSGQRARGQGSIHVFPTMTGLRIVPGGPGTIGGEGTTINGSTEPFVTDVPIRHWRFRFARSKSVFVEVNAPVPGVPRLAPDSIVFNSSTSGEFELNGVDVGGDLRFAGSVLELHDTTIGRHLKARMRHRDGGYVDASDVTVSGDTSIRFTTRRRLNNRTNPLEFRRCAFAALRVRTAIGNFAVDLDGCTASGDVLFDGDNDLRVRNCSIDGSLSAKSAFDLQQIEFENVRVGGDARLATGQRDDTIRLDFCSFGALDVRGGSGNDTLETVEVTIDGDGTYRGGGGAADRWLTDEQELLVTGGVEETGPAPPR